MTMAGIHAQGKTPAMQGGSGTTMISLIGLDVEICLGDETISMQELKELAELKCCWRGSGANG